MSCLRPLRFCVLRSAAFSVAQPRFMSSVALPMVEAPTLRSSALSFPSIPSIITRVIEELADGIMLLKRTFQPSLLRRKRKHGFLARLHDRNGRKVLNRRLEKGRRSLSA